MAEERRPMQVPDLLAALTAYGLGGARPWPRADEGPTGSQPVRRSWLARCLQRTAARQRKEAP